MRSLKLTLAYDGTAYAGWQRQANGLSIQQVVEEAFGPLFPDSGHELPVVEGASRTDAGVHALGQVASVQVDLTLTTSAIQRALNARLPGDIRVLDVADATPAFHARAHSVGKAYRYRIETTPVLSPFDRHYVWHAPWIRDVDVMQRAAAVCLGRHDFVSFQAGGSTVRETVRTIHRFDVSRAGSEIVIDIEGDGFLRHMVRALVGTLGEMSSGARPADSMPAILEARDRQAAGPTAPPQGLTLVSVAF